MRQISSDRVKQIPHRDYIVNCKSGVYNSNGYVEESFYIYQAYSSKVPPLRAALNNRKIKIVHLDATNQIADIFTKPLKVDELF